MSAKRRRRAKRTYSAGFKAQVVARVVRGRADRSETQRAIADELGITETRISDWVRLAQKKRATLTGPVEAESASPSIELRGLRAWVNQAVRVEVERILAEKQLHDEALPRSRRRRP